MGTDVAPQRQRMVHWLRAEGITDGRVLAAMAEVPRERFVPPEVAAEAYSDRPLPIGQGQTISSPFIVAATTAALELPSAAHVLEVGTGCGYGAAVLSHCFRSVLTIERHEKLAERARRTLAELGYDNIEVRVGDGSAGAPDRAPFDGVLVTAMAQWEPPPALLDQLAAGGSLVCPVGQDKEGDLLRIRDGRRERLGMVSYVPLVVGGR